MVVTMVMVTPYCYGRGTKGTREGVVFHHGTGTDALQLLEATARPESKARACRTNGR